MILPRWFLSTSDFGSFKKTVVYLLIPIMAETLGLSLDCVAPGYLVDFGSPELDRIAENVR